MVFCGQVPADISCARVRHTFSPARKYAKSRRGTFRMFPGLLRRPKRKAQKDLFVLCVCVLSCCGARQLPCRRRGCVICRPLPLRLAKSRPPGGCSLAWRLRAHIALVALSATGSAPIAPPFGIPLGKRARRGLIQTPARPVPGGRSAQRSAGVLRFPPPGGSP